MARWAITRSLRFRPRDDWGLEIRRFLFYPGEAILDTVTVGYSGPPQQPAGTLKGWYFDFSIGQLTNGSMRRLDLDGQTRAFVRRGEPYSRTTSWFAPMNPLEPVFALFKPSSFDTSLTPTTFEVIATITLVVDRTT